MVTVGIRAASPGVVGIAASAAGLWRSHGGFSSGLTVDEWPADGGLKSG